MFEIWFDPLSIGIVFLGTLAAAMLRCGPRETGAAIVALAGLFARPFDAAKARAGLAGHVRAIADDGLVRVPPLELGDREFDALSATMIARRSVGAIHAEHERFKRLRTVCAKRATHVFESAAELAPVLGLAGTLIALGQAPAAAGQDTGLVDAIGMAVVTTLWGLVAANFVFAPIAAAIARRAQQEDCDRDEVVDWIVRGLGTAEPTPIRAAPPPAESPRPARTRNAA